MAARSKARKRAVDVLYEADIRSYQQVLIAAHESGDKHAEAESLSNLGEAYYMLDDMRRAIDYHQEALTVVRALGDKHAEAKNLNKIARSYVRSHDFDTAIQYDEQALAIAREIGDRNREGNYLRCLGAWHERKRDHEQAINFYEQALAIARETGDRDNEAENLLNLGLVKHHKGDPESALPYVQESLSIHQSLGVGWAQSRTLGLLGSIYAHSIGDTPQGISFYEQALSVARNIDHTTFQTAHLNSLGQLMGDKQKARAYYEEALDIARKNENKQGEEHSLSNLAYIDGTLKNRELSLSEHQQALVLAREMGDRDKESHHLYSIGLAYKGLKDFEQAMTQLKDKTGKYGMSTSLDDNQVFKLWVKQRGGTLYNEAGTALGYEDDQIYVDFFNMLKGWMDKKLIPTREFEVSQGEIAIEDNIFVRQEAAMGYMHSNQIVAVASANGGRPIDALPFPKQEGPNPEPGNYLKPSQFWSITANCPKEQADVAAKIINFFTNDLKANEVLFAERGVPISSAVREHLLPMLDAAGAETFDYLERVQADSSPLPPPDPPKWSDFTNNVYNPLFRDPLIYQQITVEEAIPILEAEGNAVLGG